MTDHQAAATARAVPSNSVRNTRFGDFGRSPGTLDENSSQNSGQSLGAGGAAWGIWGTSAIGSTTIGSGFGATTSSNNERRGSLEGKQGSSSLLAGSGEHEPWSNTKPTAVGWTGESTSPALSNVAISQDHSRSPARLRSQQYDSPQTSSEVPRTSSPYYSSIPRQAAVGQGPSMSQSPSSKSYLDPASAVSFGETLDFQNGGRGRGLEMGQGFGDRRHLGSVLGAIEDEDPNHTNRGRVVSNPRGVNTGAEILGTSVSSASRSESLPPQQRANSTPPTYNPNQTPQEAAGYGAYTHVPTSHPASHGPNHPNVGNYPVGAQGRYTDLTRDTRQAEMLAQFRQVSVEDENDQFPDRRRLPFTGSFNQPQNNPGNLNYPSQPSFADYQYQQQQRQNAQAVPQSSSPWATEEGTYTRGQEGFSNDQYNGDGYVEGYNEFRTRPYERVGAMSPGDQNVDFQRRSLASPYYPNGTTPPQQGDFRSASRGATARTPPSVQLGLNHEKLRQRLLVTQQQQQSPHLSQSQTIMRDQLYRTQQQQQQQQQFPMSGPYDYTYSNLRMQMPAYPGGSPISPLAAPTHPAARRHDDIGSLRSALLEEFRSNSKSNKRYELKDIYGHVVEFSGDQHGSRFIQQKLETANSDEKDIVFAEIKPNSLQLMTDVFGNYVIQKFFEHGNQLQKSVLAKQMENHVLTLSLQMYGCRVVQKALEHILTEQQATLVKELDGHVLKCVKDQNGNHVVQKAIERVPAEHIQFIIKAFHGQVQTLATHPYGCRVIQRMLEHCDETAQASLLQELHFCTQALVQDQYGNYVTQHVIEHGKAEDRAKIVNLVTSQLLHFSKHKFASNVVEKSIAFGSPDQKREIVKVVCATRPDGTSPLQILMRDQYGNYVIQKLLTLLSGQDRETLVEQIKPQLQALKKFTYGKQINAIEKLIYNSSTPSQTASPPPGSSAATPPDHTPESTEVSSTTSNAGEVPVVEKTTE
ncbi:uncharacterized protein H6S33_012387 [Morchella sextelata]|uniref:uncharacterized protein n=1 Tax=Morchella sextelata TaxID=1174677 RepID=UPI001D037F61|nr:uncharacterized protein H6S33_012387 [Morchella sextelata]KAH0609841.1 hypothetical protein H6S33_012387 [Morchella sextelata]